MRTFLLASLAMLCSVTFLFGQNKSSNPWSFTPESELEKSSPQRQIIPQAYQTLRLDVTQMQTLLAKAPLWMTPEAESESILLTLPMPDGTFQDFEILEAPVMHPDLAAKFPMIKSYAGIGIDDPTAYLRFDMTQKGFHAMVRTSKTSTVYIDPYSTADIENYISYYRKDFQNTDFFECHFDEVNEKPKKKKTSSVRMAGDCTFRTYVLALACTGEYANFHGGNTVDVLAAMVTTMTRVNGVFENDISVHMELHPDTDDLIFLDPSTDPYSNGSGGAMLGQNQTTCDNIIGNANYDIGHVFSTGGGGVAYLGAVCNSSIKAGGVTGQNSPVGDPFDIDYVSHEMGHQYGANHTQNNNCNRVSATAMEPGSASTIMGYAGICSPNVQNNSDDYFHAISMQEMGNEITSGTNGGSGNGGNTCSTNTNINDAPTANAGADYTIPSLTPFVLTGTGTDPNGDTLTYTWEQMDNQVASMPPQATNTSGPAFRSFKGTTSPSRYLPRLQDLVNNVSPTWEVLSSVNRSYNFRVTVRDNHFGGSCSEEDDMVVTVSSVSGPFLVTAPNTAVIWPALSSQTVTWDVANTTAAPVSCANVDIFLSLDGGFTYPITLATATPNDGSHTVTLPNNQTTQARIMVKGSGNIFFDISNEDFTIDEPEDNFTFDVSPNALGICSPADAVFDVNIGVTGTFTGDVTLAVTGEPAGSLVGFSANPVSAPGSSVLTIGNMTAVTPGNYSLVVSGTGSTGTQSETVVLNVANGIPPAVTLTTPSNGATGVSNTPDLEWNAIAGATSYSLQVASDAGFTNLLVNETGLSGTSYSVTSTLNLNSTYHWRVKALNTCGEGAWSTAFSFTTFNIVCTTYVSTNVPVSISSSGTPTVTSTLTIPDAGIITDVNVLDLDVNHTWINDLIIDLESPANTERNLISQICGSQNDILLSLDDESGNAYSSIPCPPNGGTYQPNETLSVFDGENLNGTWTLTIQDVFNQDGGSLEGWGLEVCYTPLCTPPTANAPTVTQPTCSTPTGAITVNASGGGPLEYSVDNGGSWQTSPTFAGLAPGSYNLVVRLQNEPSCNTAFAGNPVSILAVPALPNINAPAVTPPTCPQPTGTIVVNATGSGQLEYSLDNGISWQTSPTFSGLLPEEYDIMVRLQNDPSCVVEYLNNPVEITLPPAPSTYYLDADEDGFGNPNASQSACTQPAGYVTDNTDCNDSDANEFPGQTWYLDGDGDGYSEGSSQVGCGRPANHFTAGELTATNGDCDDSNADVNPGASEVCNGIDDDCDSEVDEGVLITYYQDSDGDSFGNPAVTQQACSAPIGYVTDNTDCDDSDANEFPGQTWYLDGDGDGYSEGSSQMACERPAGHFTAAELTQTDGDCDDSNADVNPGASEVCNGIDDDCDSELDEGVLITFFEDADADGFGDPNSSLEACMQPNGYVTNNTDNCPMIFNPDQDDEDQNGIGDICQACPINLTIYPYAPEQTTFQAQMEVSTTGNVTVPDGTVRVYKAENSVILNADFKVELGGELDILIETCTPLQGSDKKE